MTAKQRAQRERVLNEAAGLFAQGVTPPQVAGRLRVSPQVAGRLRVSRKSAYAWHARWMEGGAEALRPKGPPDRPSPMNCGAEYPGRRRLVPGQRRTFRPGSADRKWTPTACLRRTPAGLPGRRPSELGVRDRADMSGPFSRIRLLLGWLSQRECEHCAGIIQANPEPL
uniref:helix-turn-helix domain-containing protein n=1 Tax=Streptomyces rimosus TaxID=1927 RepID=UPI002D21C725|nr:helix-turn-helix domain-containing protein [Streptomyces rimosus]